MDEPTITGDLHPLLARQLRKLGLAPGQAADASAVDGLLTRITRAYADVDQERYLLERSQELASREMAALNQALRVSQARLGSLLSLSSDWVWEQDEGGHFISVSDDLQQRTGLHGSTLIGHACSAEGPLRAGADDLARLQGHQARHQTFRHITFEVHADAAAADPARHLCISGEPVFDGTRLLGWRGVGSDVTATVLADRKILELARYDNLTGLPNRYLFMEELARALARSARYGRSFALLFIDLDRFKFVNDNLGHAAGDELLRTVGARLTRLLREVDMLGRLGGDEFVVLTESNCEPATLSKVASRVLAAVSEPMLLDGRSVQISASVGVAIYPGDGADAFTLLKSADAAMYQAKARGKNTFEFFTADLAQRAALHFALEGDLRLAVERGELVLHYQPQVCTATGALVGLEALVRWQHPERGLLAPAAFIDLAEESGLIVPMGRWVLQEACRQLAAWRADGLTPPRCAVNVSVRQLTDDTLLGDVQRALLAAGIDADDLEVEVTESSLMADAKRANEVLEKLSALGVGVAIDDFGTGYSSLSYLKKFSAQTLKIDRSFISGLPLDPDDLAITRAVVAMGHSLGMRIVAEGVETEAQHSCLQAMGCDVLQGYFFGRPVPAAALAEQLRGPPCRRLSAA